MLQYATWHGRISKAWRKKMKGRKPNEWMEFTTRMQEGRPVTLILYPDRHSWTIMNKGQQVLAVVNSDMPLSQAELIRWLEKTTPIERAP